MHTDTWCEIQKVLFPKEGSTFQEWTKGSLFPSTLHRAVESTCRQREPEGAAVHLLMGLPGALGRAQELSAHSLPPAGWLSPSAPASDGGDQSTASYFHTVRCKLKSQMFTNSAKTRHRKLQRGQAVPSCTSTAATPGACTAGLNLLLDFKQVYLK